MLEPHEGMLAEKMCDFIEELWVPLIMNPLMKLEYKPGRANVVANGLSQAPVEDSGTVGVMVNQVIEDPVLVKVQKEQRQDGELNDLIQYLETKVLPEDEVKRQKVLFSAQQGYYIVDGILYFESADVPDRRRLVVPTRLRQRIVEEHHNPIFAGHFSERKLLGKLKRMYYWQGMRQDAHQKLQAVWCVHQCKVRRGKSSHHLKVSKWVVHLNVLALTSSKWMLAIVETDTL